MKIFGKSKKVEPKPSKPAASRPTDSVDRKECQVAVLRHELAGVEGISPDDKEAMCAFIAQPNDGLDNRSLYTSQFYEQYFEGKEWRWPEYEYWNDRFAKLGRYPNSFLPKRIITTETVLNELTVPELKALLKEKGAAFTSKAKKQELIDLALSIADIGQEPIVQDRMEKALEGARYEVYSILMRTISFRASTLHNYNRARRSGVKKFEILQTFEPDKEFADMALKEKPDALPPLYPYDFSQLYPIIEF